MNKLIKGDTLTQLKKLPSESVQCCITSPPYWGLRNYGVAGQLGLEATPESYVARMVEVFAEVRRVLRDDGTLWLNIGDSYSQGVINHGAGPNSQRKGRRRPDPPPARRSDRPKNLVGIPWRLAFALQADGWYLRSDIIEEVELYCPCGCGHVMEERIWRHSPDRDIIWHKPNPMPESVRDRPTKAHEYVFLLSKSARYFFDAEAVREAGSGRNWLAAGGNLVGKGLHKCGDGYRDNGDGRNGEAFGRNIRSVWTITPKPFRGAHFATFPPALVERCIKAGTPEHGCCPQCGKAWERVTERQSFGKAFSATKFTDERHQACRLSGSRQAYRAHGMEGPPPPKTLGFRPACTCPAAPAVPCVVLDPFLGSGTTAAVARSLGRDCIGIDLNPKYLTMARARIKAEQAKVALCG